MRKLSPRQKFIARVSTRPRELANTLWDAIMLASSHDPEHEDRLDVIERQLERIGAPQYRRVRKGIYAEIVRGPRSAKALKDK